MMKRSLLLALMIAGTIVPRDPQSLAGPPLYNAAGPDSVRAQRPDSTRPDSTQNSLLNVFLDCPTGCYEDYVKRECTVVNYVRDREVADVHVFLSSQPTSETGTRTTLIFVGRGRFTGANDTLDYTAGASDPDDAKQQRLLKTLQLGLLRYVAHTPWAASTLISYPRPELTAGLPGAADPWDSWAFYVDLSTSLSGQKSSNAVSFYGTLTANRYTAAAKVKLALEGTYLSNRFDIGDESILSISRNYSFKGLWALSLSDRWSAGLFGTWLTSTYANTKLSWGLAPAIEYDFFPYQESATRSLRVGYRIGPIRNVYYSETIFDQTSETLFQHTLSVSLDIRESWGDASLAVAASQYLHDLTKNHLEAQGDISVRITQGLSLHLSCDVSSIRDQLALAKFGATPEQILLYRQEVATSYSYYVTFGFSYSFGSIFQNVVNPRFGP